MTKPGIPIRNPKSAIRNLDNSQLKKTAARGAADNGVWGWGNIGESVNG
jgi:hypothetical protein